MVIIIKNEIKNHRIKAYLTQAQFAELIDVDRSTVAKWETGKAMPRAELLPRIAKVLGCNIDDLFKATA